MASCIALAAGAVQAQGAVSLVHVHGLSYSADGKRLMIPSHYGLAVYENGKWNKAPGPLHDYMGFSATASALYSSGHPAKGSGSINPFGLIRSRDGGQTWERLGLEGETDFHVLATSWNTNAIYVWNPAPNSRMRSAGLHYTVNDGGKWTQAAAAGLSGELRAIAVHPDDVKTVAIATAQGLFLSRDAGQQFRKIAAAGQGASVFFDLNGKHVWYGAYESRPKLTRLPLDDAGPGVALPLPPLKEDAVAYIAQNPVRRLEYAIATFNRNVYLSRDSGASWIQIAERGKTR